MKEQSRYIFSPLLMIVVFATLLILSHPVSIMNGQSPKPIEVEITLNESNPILSKGAPGEWDSGFVFAGNVIYKDETYHMFFAGGEDFLAQSHTISYSNSKMGGENFSAQPHAIGYATSKDGLHWEKYANNPILKMDPAISKGDIPYALPIVDGNTWMLYFNNVTAVGSGSQGIRRATASSPTGPWSIDKEPVMTKGKSADWDSLSFDIVTIIRDLDQFVLYYHGFGNDNQIGIGRATSPDGITWTKYNDPATSRPDFVNSDPVFTVGGLRAWDAHDIIPTVIHTDHGWEMFYMGTNNVGITWNVGYATSPDGITWSHFEKNPVMKALSDYKFWIEGILPVDNQYYVYYDRMMPTALDMGVAVGQVKYE